MMLASHMMMNECLRAKKEGKHIIIIRLFSNFYVCVLPKEAPGSHFQMSWSGKCKFVRNTPEE